MISAINPGASSAARPADRRTRATDGAQWLRSTLFTRSALGLAPSLTPAVAFLPLGAILGPRGLQWFTPQVLERLDTAVTTSRLAVLGVMVGVALARGMREHSRLLAAASLESAVTSPAGATAHFHRADRYSGRRSSWRYRTRVRDPHRVFRNVCEP